MHLWDTSNWMVYDNGILIMDPISMGDIKHGMARETLATNLPWMGMVSIAPIKMLVLGEGLWHWLYHTWRNLMGYDFQMGYSWDFFFGTFTMGDWLVLNGIVTLWSIVINHPPRFEREPTELVWDRVDSPTAGILSAWFFETSWNLGVPYS